MEIIRYVTGIFFENTYMVVDHESQTAIVIDPGFGAAAQVALLMEKGIRFTAIFITHPHFDHVFDLEKVRNMTGAKIYMHRDDVEVAAQFVQEAAGYGYPATPLPPPDVFCEDGDAFLLGSAKLKVIHLPGHTPGSICITCPDGVFTGDSLMSRKIGDSPEGYFNMLVTGIKEKLYTLPDHFVIYPGHYKYSTIGEEKQFNLDVF